MRSTALLFLGFLAVAACSAAPEGALDTTGSTSSALDPVGRGSPPTTYRFTLDHVLTDYTFEPPASQTNDTGYVEWAGLAVQLNKGQWNYETCMLGKAKNATALSLCGPGGSAIPGTQLYREIQVQNSVTDTVTLVVALDNLEDVNLTPPASGATNTLSTIGNGLQTYGALSALLDPEAAPFSGTLAFLGSLASFAGSFIHSTPPQMTTCAGGMMAPPPPGATTPQDTVYRTFKASELAELTAGGATWIEFWPTFTWNQGRCGQEVFVHVNIERTWDDGPAAYPRSADSAVVRVIDGYDANGNVDVAGNVDVFSVNLPNGAVQRISSVNGVPGAWSAPELVTANPVAAPGTNTVRQPRITNGDMPIAAISRTTASDDVFFFDANGDLFWSAWSPQAGWATHVVGSLVGTPSSRLTAAARTTNNLDLFWFDANGQLKTAYWANGMADFAFATLSGTQTAPAGSGIAVVAPKAEELDVFWIGKDQSNPAQTAVWQANWSRNAVTNQFVWSLKQLSYTTGIAPLGGNIVATASSVDYIDVFYVGNDGGLRRTYWGSRLPDWATVIAAPNFAQSGAKLSAVSSAPPIAPSAQWIDVVSVGANHLSHWNLGNPATTASAIATNVIVNPNANISIVEPTYGVLDVAFHDINNPEKTYSATLPYGAPSWSVQGPLADVAPPCQPTSCALRNATCGSIDDGCGHVLSCGACTGGLSCQINRCVSCTPRTCQSGYTWSTSLCACVTMECGCGGTYPNCKKCL